MTKTGKPDSYWKAICTKYAQGQFHFSTGKRPGAKKWKRALEKIDACPCRAIQRICLGGAFCAPVGSIRHAAFTHHWSPNILLLSLSGTTGRECSYLGTNEDVGDSI
ncbi:hypothetical protein N1851_030298 [Merluccius polli]|uniref:Uncharacterized protein n=1 Tax=Merluccius polli TaxID=89951 RepID=A0AA47M5S0_MERPO|nr:hypothetical protein N1851_030298 [Merluccius polli]